MMIPSFSTQVQRCLHVGVVLLSLWPVSQTTADDAADFFETNVRPVLVERCVSCHGPDKQEGELRLDSRQQVFHGNETVGALVKPGHPDESRLLQVILYSEDDVQMPPKAKLEQPQIDAIRHWIQAGAVWPEHGDFGKANAFDPNAWRQHWAFQPVTDPAPPQLAGDAKHHPIDAFVRSKLQQLSISPSPRAEGRVLVRRLAVALTGLPPAREDLEAAAALEGDPLLQWLTGYADRLLSSPQFGERWARYWLDISRYADTKGYVFQEDREYKDAWQYREWVINAYNSDMPYDEFLSRQIAGDRFPDSSDPKQLAAMGFLTLGRRFLNNVHDIIDDRIDVLCRGTQALTVGCSRCHDHKYDPIPMADYYSLYGIFNSSDEPKNEPSTLRLVDLEKPREPVIFLRGNPASRGDRITRHFLTALSPPGEPEAFTDGSGRLELARKITSKDNPLTARVAVNRIWLRLFGNGLVDSPSDFGVRTAPPSHPELLDHLSSYFMQHNWSRKQLIRYMVLSETWLQSSAPREDVFEQDPENRLLCRMPRRRLDFEAFRDSVLAASGDLDLTSIGGTSVDITAEPYTGRRTVYARIDRQNLPGVFRTFDFASPDSHSPKRFETTVPQQALFQMNHPFMMQRAESIAGRTLSTSGDSPEAVVRGLYSGILQREPDADELAASLSFLEASRSMAPPDVEGLGWQYGWGELSADKTAVAGFQRFPVFAQDRWSGGEKLPDAKLGWCMLNRDGGHTGHGLKFCAIRRWIADRDSTITITSSLHHGTDQGDGVHGHIICRGQSLGSVHAHHAERPLSVAAIPVSAGESVDFVAESGANESHDSFRWKISIRQEVDGQVIRQWISDKDFSGGAARTRLKPVQQLAQTLFLTNEFMFVD
ncbi:MAG: PSD1 domain-containing protein [Planctomycetaceae bacterium]|nr:PSD1 domain-containing protein [Planctomycetaceae bacterium]